MREWLDVAFVLVLDPTGAAVGRLEAKLATPLVPERSTWGTSRDSVAAYYAAEREAGGPAPRRRRDRPT